MSVAQREIKKFYGDKIANSPEVKNALKYANESVEFTLDMISEDEIKVNHENPKDRAEGKLNLEKSYNLKANKQRLNY